LVTQTFPVSILAFIGIQIIDFIVNAYLSILKKTPYFPPEKVSYISFAMLYLITLIASIVAIFYLSYSVLLITIILSFITWSTFILFVRISIYKENHINIKNLTKESKNEGK
jgi:hypothetical protein